MASLLQDDPKKDLAIVFCQGDKATVEAAKESLPKEHKFYNFHAFNAASEDSVDHSAVAVYVCEDFLDKDGKVCNIEGTDSRKWEEKSKLIGRVCGFRGIEVCETFKLKGTTKPKAEKKPKAKKEKIEVPDVASELD